MRFFAFLCLLCLAIVPASALVKSVVILDDFYSNPDEVRALALSANYTVRGNYPGLRTKSYTSDSIKKYIEDQLGLKITYWETERDIDYNGAFQYTTKDHTSWVHQDPTSWAGVLYLTPDAPPSGGTCFYRHKETGLEWEATQRDAEKMGLEKKDDVTNLLYKDANDMSKWELVDQIGNRYNRLVLFRGKRWHMSNVYFGDNLQNGRLFQTFFFMTEI